MEKSLTVSIRLTNGMIDGKYISLPRDFFPEECIGRVLNDFNGTYFELNIADQLILTTFYSTQYTGIRNIRGFGEFIDKNKLKENDILILSKISKYEYRIDIPKSNTVIAVDDKVSNYKEKYDHKVVVDQIKDYPDNYKHQTVKPINSNEIVSFETISTNPTLSSITKEFLCRHGINRIEDFKGIDTTKLLKDKTLSFQSVVEITNITNKYSKCDDIQTEEQIILETQSICKESAIDKFINEIESFHVNTSGGKLYKPLLLLIIFSDFYHGRKTINHFIYLDYKKRLGELNRRYTPFRLGKPNLHYPFYFLKSSYFWVLHNMQVKYSHSPSENEVINCYACFDQDIFSLISQDKSLLKNIIERVINRYWQKTSDKESLYYDLDINTNDDEETVTVTCSPIIDNEKDGEILIGNNQTIMEDNINVIYGLKDFLSSKHIIELNKVGISTIEELRNAIYGDIPELTETSKEYLNLKLNQFDDRVEREKIDASERTDKSSQHMKLDLYVETTDSDIAQKEVFVVKTDNQKSNKKNDIVSDITLKSSNIFNFDELSVSNVRIDEIFPFIIQIDFDEFISLTSARTSNCIRRAGIRNVEELARRNTSSIFKIKNMGMKSFVELLEILSSLHNCLDKKEKMEINALNKPLIEVMKFENILHSKYALDSEIMSNNFPLYISKFQDNKIENIKDLLGYSKQQLIDVFGQVEAVSIIDILYKIQNLISEQIELENKVVSLEDLLVDLSEKEKRILKDRFVNDMTLESIGYQFNITRERTRQIIVRANEKVSHSLNKKLNKYKISLIIENLNNKQIIERVEFKELANKYVHFNDSDMQFFIAIINEKFKTIKFHSDFIFTQEIGNLMDKLIIKIHDERIIDIKDLFIFANCFDVNIQNLILKFLLVFDKTIIIKENYCLSLKFEVNKVLYLFHKHKRPIMLQELSELYNEEFNESKALHALEACLQHLDVFVRVNRGTYALSGVIKRAIMEDNDIIQLVTQCFDKRQTPLFLNKIIEIVSDNSHHSYTYGDFLYLLTNHTNFKALGRDYFVLNSSQIDSRKYMDDIIYDFFLSKMKPITINEIIEELNQNGRYVEAWSLNGNLSKNSKYKRINNTFWVLSEWDYTLDEKKVKLNTSTNEPIKNISKEHTDYLTELNRKFIYYREQKTNKNHKFYYLLYYTPQFLEVLFELYKRSDLLSNSSQILFKVIEYFCNPYDLLPEEFLGMAGYLDDIVFVAMSINQLLEINGNSLLEMISWNEIFSFLEILKEITDNAEEMVGINIYRELQGMLIV